MYFFNLCYISYVQNIFAFTDDYEYIRRRISVPGRKIKRRKWRDQKRTNEGVMEVK